MIDSFATEDDLEKEILKTVGVLNLHDDDDLPVTEESAFCALSPLEVARSIAYPVMRSRNSGRVNARYGIAGREGSVVAPHLG